MYMYLITLVTAVSFLLPYVHAVAQEAPATAKEQDAKVTAPAPPTPKQLVVYMGVIATQIIFYEDEEDRTAFMGQAHGLLKAWFNKRPMTAFACTPDVDTLQCNQCGYYDGNTFCVAKCIWTNC